MKSLGLSMEVAEAVGRLWEVVIRDMGAESDFTAAIKPIEKAAGVVVGGAKGGSRGEVKRPLLIVVADKRSAIRDPQISHSLHDAEATARHDHQQQWLGSPRSAGTTRGERPHSHGAGLSIAISSSTSTRGRTTAYWSSLTSTSGTSARVL